MRLTQQGRRAQRLGQPPARGNLLIGCSQPQDDVVIYL